MLTSQEIAAALNLTRAEMVQEYRAVRYMVDTCINARHWDERARVQQAQAILTGRAKQAIESRKTAAEWAAEHARVEALFAAADKAAGWA